MSKSEIDIRCQNEQKDDAESLAARARRWERSSRRRAPWGERSGDGLVGREKERDLKLVSQEVSGGHRYAKNACVE